ncbi:hypothetical protein [Bythopirellula polymerisocia]|uniref:Uncharacterized protein n=1 Tax=Bythopirellula polymerisocia TaxID=2528003 RepID=A0A5C6D0V4_9BACT|nr:hypothetical protein [Bythopirellula polymerisocia]TWU29454.1 hypothetical protein Pla144_02320 [Bythopirellula polymerisocia]
MSERTWMQKSGATPRKLALVVCLAVGLVFVLWNQQTDGTDETLVSRSTPQSPPNQQAEVANKNLVSQKVDAESKEQIPLKWPQMPLERVVKNDPFAMPAWYLATIVDPSQSSGEIASQTEQLLEKLRNEQRMIVVISNGERIATFGDESFRVGDTVAGYEITEINTDGIVLTEIHR